MRETGHLSSETECQWAGPIDRRRLFVNILLWRRVYANVCAQVTSSCTSDPNKLCLELDYINALFIMRRTF